MPVRRVTEDDLEAFVGILAAVAEEGQWIASEAPVDVPRRVADLRTRMAGGDMLFLLEEDGRVLGGGSLHASLQRGVAMLGMALLADARGRGLGRRLLEAMIEQARENGIARIDLEVFPHNERAIALYETAGFQAEELRREHLLRRDGSRKDVLAMSLKVPVSQ